ncbi:hypothetical protein AMK59_5042 [Oryctes borbonicus]|uniref:PWWP domain-containing protein n=1 Tax=Oryctes borbonicus TaxID=1629725 RepID=A0A0T6B1D8_9SCAR|nr:hypothetical protein AMK59_5042 [Oryctes borbonicus]
MPAKYKSNKMTVRLRPRQVLCSKCKGICNENSENVTRKRKNSETNQNPPIKRGANAPITRSVHSEINKRKINVDNKHSNQKSEVTSSNSISISNKVDVNPSKRPLLSVPLENKHGNMEINNEHQDDDSTHSLDHSDASTNLQHQEQVTPTMKAAKRVFRKKRSEGSMEDLWDETVLEEGSKNNNQNSQSNANSEQPLTSTCINTRTIKISYGPQGEGTVLKIPAQIENLNVSDDSEENVKAEDTKSKIKDENNKAARKALKKAKKEARKKILYSGTSPSYLGSPRYSIGTSSPRYTIGSASPRHGLGGISPRYNVAYDSSSTRRKKHKMKHKKKHRDEKEKKHKDIENTNVPEDIPKEQIVTQKLSINLKRLNNTYTSCPSTAENEDSGSEDLSDQVPNFPPMNSPLVLRLNAPSLSSAMGANGCRLLIGDVVWGKIHGFPWWPGKVLTITSGDNKGPQAHVSWYGSPTSSLIQCDQLSPYLENFKTRYNKKKRGPYKEAIKQATTEARENAENRLRESIVSSSPARSIINVVPPALASPREIDVVS